MKTLIAAARAIALALVAVALIIPVAIGFVIMKFSSK